MGASNSTPASAAAARAFIERVTTQNNITVFSKTYCPYCTKAKDVLRKEGVAFHVVELNTKNDEPTGTDIQNALAEMTGRKTVPNVFLKQRSIGGGDDVKALQDSGELRRMLQKEGIL